jgi:hypothetical protein
MCTKPGISSRPIHNCVTKKNAKKKVKTRKKIAEIKKAAGLAPGGLIAKPEFRSVGTD